MPNFLPLLIISCSLLISACATQKLANSDELQSKALADATALDISPEEMISRASERLNNAAQELRFYSPLHMQKAQEQLEQARKLHQGGKAENKTSALAAAILAEKLVKQAEDNREQVKQQLAPALAHRQILIELGSPDLLPADYNSAMADLNKLIQSVESGQLDYVAKNQPELLADFIKVEASTLKVKWLNRAKAKLDEAEDADADKFAPKSFEQAELAIERADAYTDSNYRDREGVKAKADEAYVLAAKALNITTQVQKVFEKKISELESYMLDVQSWLDNINQDVKVPDLAALNFYEQSRAIAARVFEQINQQNMAAEQSVEAVTLRETQTEPLIQALPEDAQLIVSPLEATNEPVVEVGNEAPGTIEADVRNALDNQPVNEVVIEPELESEPVAEPEPVNEAETVSEDETVNASEIAREDESVNETESKPEEQAEPEKLQSAE